MIVDEHTIRIVDTQAQETDWGHCDEYLGFDHEENPEDQIEAQDSFDFDRWIDENPEALTTYVDANEVYGDEAVPL